MKKRNKVSAEFSMSSLTDIIFLLLIFFMLTSNTVQINVDLPQSDSKTVAPTDLSVQLFKNGKILVNSKNTSKKNLEKRIAVELKPQTNKDNGTISIIAETGVSWSRIHDVMKIASGLEIKAIIATAPRSN
ncbi:MAG: biopolymer transporter ExbD [Saprospiraceae bacterium]|nr:biopolymer transporter ExbD [Saprospiraceae bacterium]